MLRDFFKTLRNGGTTRRQATTDSSNYSFYTPFAEAVIEIEKRRRNTDLRQKVEVFLKNDIPEVFKGDTPIFYLSRHVATPNYETLRFIELTIGHKFDTVIGQDTKDKFVSNNCLKRALGKMPILKESTRHGDEIIENFTIIDFNTYQGKPLHSCTTKTNENLVEFHNNLLFQIYPTGVKTSDEADWIDRNFRGDLYKHYVRYLSLMLVHGITLEDYVDEDLIFVNESLLPAIKTVTDLFGVKPLICKLIPKERSLEKDWVNYPSVVYPFVKRVIK